MFPSAASHRALSSFEVLERLGSGAAGQVFLAKSKAGRLVAIKVLSDAKERDDKFADVLVREAQLCVRLTHPAIVQVRAFLEDEGFAAIVFDYVKGIALSRLMRFCAAAGARLPDPVAWHIVERVLSALAFAHAQKDVSSGEPAPIVHRDVSPSNVLVDWSGDVKLTDFGIAKMLGVSPATQFGLVKGTLGCMAPEQARGEPVDERADVYAAGLLAWRLGTGRHPFAKMKEEIELLRAMRHPRIKPLGALRPDLPESLVLAVAAALEPDQGSRTITAEELARVVRDSFEMEAGKKELATLLERFRSVLERPPQRADGATASDSSGHQKHNTMRYEQAAFIDDDLPPDGPTIETHALPGDERRWAELASELDLPRVSVSPSEGARSSKEALAVAKETPFPPLTPFALPTAGLAKALQPVTELPEPSKPEEPAPAPPPPVSRGGAPPSPLVATAIVLGCTAIGAVVAWLLTR